MTILALDLGTTTGWALRLRSTEVISGSQAFKPARFEGGGMRYLKFSRWLSEVVGEGADLGGGDIAKPAVVVFEEVRRHQGVDAAHAYGGFLATLTSWCEHRGIPYMAVPVATIKKHVTGKGNASKEEVIKAIRKLKYTPEDDNEADALAIMEWAVSEGHANAKKPVKQRRSAK